MRQRKCDWDSEYRLRTIEGKVTVDPKKQRTRKSGAAAG